jgi:hypothetical protein
MKPLIISFVWKYNVLYPSLVFWNYMEKSTDSVKGRNTLEGPSLDAADDDCSDLMMQSYKTMHLFLRADFTCSCVVDSNASQTHNSVASCNPFVEMPN